ncbi:hypothetical protein PTTG_25641 [Puccinia triticina 1-1 BBBD Race 1]|uniref:CxC1 domain-containing protein n=1 Tax=Puccinia triticina (isolate 1-1 / race 1 (BBBD)) TaxID=630390 RepID=A0A180H0V1_PUCT1|nr:hypothetical protein PTTG_25641 [Puccinia triticina 1-1 BBBD Race 1]
MPSTRMRIRNANRTQTHRRQVYSDRNAATLSRLQRQAEVGCQREQAAQPPDIGNILDWTSHDYPFDAQQESANQNQAEDKSEWGNFSEDELDEIDLAMASYKEQYRQKAREYNWNILLGQLHAEYMKLKVITKSWSGPNLYNNFSSCSPTCSKRSSRSVDLVDIRGQERKVIDFCECTLDGVRLLQHGYIAGSPVKPQTAFLVPLLIFHNHLWNNCHIGALPFTLALTAWLEPCSQWLCARNAKHAREMQKPFTAAVDLFRLLKERTSAAVFRSLNLSKAQTLACTSCPACFGPRPPNPEDYSESTRDCLIVCLDGNFQHRHQTNASRNYEVLQTPQIFLPQSEVDQASNSIQAKESEGMTAEQV